MIVLLIAASPLISQPSVEPDWWFGTLGQVQSHVAGKSGIRLRGLPTKAPWAVFGKPLTAEQTRAAVTALYPGTKWSLDEEDGRTIHRGELQALPEVKLSQDQLVNSLRGEAFNSPVSCKADASNWALGEIVSKSKWFSKTEFSGLGGHQLGSIDRKALQQIADSDLKKGFSNLSGLLNGVALGIYDDCSFAVALTANSRGLNAVISAFAPGEPTPRIEDWKASITLHQREPNRDLTPLESALEDAIKEGAKESNLFQEPWMYFGSTESENSLVMRRRLIQAASPRVGGALWSLWSPVIKKLFEDERLDGISSVVTNCTDEWLFSAAVGGHSPVREGAPLGIGVSVRQLGELLLISPLAPDWQGGMGSRVAEEKLRAAHARPEATRVSEFFETYGHTSEYFLQTALANLTLEGMKWPMWELKALDGEVLGVGHSVQKSPLIVSELVGVPWSKLAAGTQTRLIRLVSEGALPGLAGAGRYFPGALGLHQVLTGKSVVLALTAADSPEYCFKDAQAVGSVYGSHQWATESSFTWQFASAMAKSGIEKIELCREWEVGTRKAPFLELSIDGGLGPFASQGSARNGMAIASQFGKWKENPGGLCTGLDVKIIKSLPQAQAEVRRKDP